MLIPMMFLLVGCPKDETETESLRPYDEVYNEDINEIEDFLANHKMDVDVNYNVTFTKIDATNPGTPIKDRTDLSYKIINKHGINYKLYYLTLREGTNTENYQPTKYDSIHCSYKGQFCTKDEQKNFLTTTFDYVPNPDWLELDKVIEGWGEIFPLFKPGSFVQNGDGTVNYSDFGAGVMFIPSGLAYFNGYKSVTAYTPIMFSFKLTNMRYKDHDRDKILTKDEIGSDLSNILDTDGDGAKDYFDVDDDNDGYLTKNEYDGKTVILTGSSTPVSIPMFNNKYIYSQLPDCSGNQFVIPNKPKHLNSSCH